MNAEKVKKVIFFVPPQFTILDLAGPIEVFNTAAKNGAKYRLVFSSLKNEMITCSGLSINKLELFSKVKAKKDDLIIIPGIDHTFANENALTSLGENFYKHLNYLHSQGAVICSTCTGAFILAHAGLLDHKECTTHWNYTKKLREMYPLLKVRSNCLFVKNDNIYTSAGVTSGIDLSLSIVEEEYGPVFANKIARTLVVFIRRNGYDKQLSVYLDYRSHLNPGIHKVQSYIVNHPYQQNSIESLSEIASMSPRNLTRVFKKETGITIKEYSIKVKLELGRHLMNNPNMTIEAISTECGFTDPRQFRRLWKNNFNISPSNSRLLLKTDSKLI